MTKASSSIVTRWTRGATVFDLVCVVVFFVLVGLWYAGPAFRAHFSDGIPVSAVGGVVGHMTPGDQYEAYYRHSLAYFNLERGKPLLYSGYQYALSKDQVFVDGMIYLPFTLLVALMATVIGPVAAYNAMAILSFAFNGVAGYLLGREMTSSRLAGWVAAGILACLPFRIGFLFGEMFYATDMAFLPLALFFFIRLMRTRDWRYAASFSTVVLLLATANFALLYWTLVLVGPFFLVGTVYIAYTERTNVRRLCAIALAAALPLLITAVYVLHVKRVLGGSGLAAGQRLEELMYYSPHFGDLLQRWEGIERTVYTGIAGVLAIFGIATIVRLRKDEANGVRYMAAVYIALAFPLSYMLAFGLNFDIATHIPLYKALFKFVPFANASRTPGRLMPIVGVFAATLAAIFMAALLSKLKSKKLRVSLMALIVLLVVADFRFSNVSMSTLEARNQAYAAINGSEHIALGIPFRQEADNYLNTTFQYFALTNNIRMVNGHSSTFPANWRDFYGTAKSLNYGEATRDVLRDLWARGVRYIVAHNTAYAPNVSVFAIAVLDANPALRRLREDDGIVLYEIVNPELAPDHFNASNYVEALRRNGSPMLAGPLSQQEGGVEELSGWYPREAYPGQRPFRWMAGTSSLLFVTPRPGVHASTLVFDYQCPTGSLGVSGLDTRVASDDVLEEGWHRIVVDLPGGMTSVITIQAPSIYTVPTDPRQLGCMIGDLKVQ